MTIKIFEHQLESTELAKRIKSVVEQVKKQYEGMITNFTEEWPEEFPGQFAMFKFSMLGSDIWITFESDESELAIETNDPSPQVMSVIIPKIEAALK